LLTVYIMLVNLVCAFQDSLQTMHSWILIPRLFFFSWRTIIQVGFLSFVCVSLRIYIFLECHFGMPLRNASSECHYGMPLRNATWECHFGMPLRNATSECHFGMPLRNATLEYNFGMQIRNATSECNFAMQFWNAISECNLRKKKISQRFFFKKFLFQKFFSFFFSAEGL
jgi:hypothetical protein